MAHAHGSRPTPNTTRSLLLDAARELVLERFRSGVAPHHALAYLTPALVASRAGVSRGTIYHYWGGDDATDDRPFERMLAEVAEQLWEDSVDVEDLDLLASVLPDNLTDLVLELTAFEFDRLTVGDDAVMFRASTTMVLHGVDLSHRYDASIRQLSVVYGVGLARLGRRMREPLRTTDLARAIACLTAGVVLDELYDPAAEPRHIDWQGTQPRATSSKPWTPFAVAVEALVLGMTEPDPGRLAPGAESRAG